MSDQQPNYKMTAKMPLLIGGILLALFGWFLTLKGTRKAMVAGIALIVGGVSMILWSESIHNWCVPDDQKWGNTTFEKMRFHDGPPSLQDCMAMVGVAKPVTSFSADDMKAKIQALPK